MARREGLYEVDGELVSERTPPVRWRALSYTQPMSERVPGRGKGKLMRVMFDSNTTRFAPLRRAQGYRVYRRGELVEQRGEIQDLWRDDLVAFLLGCSLTFEHALIEAGVSVRNVELGTLAPMFISNLTCRAAGRFSPEFASARFDPTPSAD